MAATLGAKQANGVLPISASQTSGTAAKSLFTKPSSPRLKLVIRRLAPGLTEREFTTILGTEWEVGHGKVDWLCYEPGKDSRKYAYSRSWRSSPLTCFSSPSKPSRPSRAYLHLTAEAHLMSLAELIRQSGFEDAQNTFADPALIGPPAVEFATYGRIPGGRRRTDARAGTIDQDAEFMSFLEALANPTTGRDLAAETLAEVASGKPEKVTTTPLVQFLKDKKASKSRDAAAKAAKKQESQSAKKSVASSEDAKKKGKENKLVERAAKEAVKILNREATSKIASASSTSGQSPGDAVTRPPKLDVTKVPGRQRSSIVAAHIRMLQRDLGLSPAQAHRQVRRDTADAQKAEKAAAVERATSEADGGSSSQVTQSAAIPTAPKGGPATISRRSRAKASTSENPEAIKQLPIPSGASTAPPTPMVLLKKPETSQQSRLIPAAPPAKVTSARPARKPQLAVPSEGATQAFVKHANPSQGVTEVLLREALEEFGAVSMVEIDKRKGFAYVDFFDAAGLKKAMAANPISVAQGTVQVMQRKGTPLPPDKKPQIQAPHAPSRGGRGSRGGTIGRRGGRGGSGRGGTGQASALESSKAPVPAPAVP